MNTYKKAIAALTAAAALAWIPSAAASGSAPEKCVTAPVSVNNQSVLGQDVPGAKDVKICVRTDAGLKGEPQIREYEGCGKPCFAVVIRDLAVSFDVKLSLTYTLGGKPQPAESLGATQTVEPLSGTHQCVYSHYEGDLNPCRDGVSTPANLSATGARTQIALEWDRSFAFGESSIQHYEILRSATGEPGTFEPVGTTTALTFTDSALPRATAFWYTVVALDDRGNRSGDATPVSGSTR